VDPTRSAGEGEDVVVEPVEHEGRGGDGEGGGRAVAFPQEARAPEFRQVCLVTCVADALCSDANAKGCTRSARNSLLPR